MGIFLVDSASSVMEMSFFLSGIDEEAKLLDSSFEVDSIRANLSELAVHSSHASVSSDSPDCVPKTEHKQRFSPRVSHIRITVHSLVQNQIW